MNVFRLGTGLLLCVCCVMPCRAENYLDTLISKIRPNFGELPKEVGEAYYQAENLRRAAAGKTIPEEWRALAETTDEKLPPDVRTFFQAQYALELERANRHPEAINVMRKIVASRREPETEETRLLLELEIARAMDDSGGHPLIAGFNPSFAEKTAAHRALFDKYYPYRRQIIDMHLKFANEAQDAAEEAVHAAKGDSSAAVPYVDVAREEYATGARLVADMMMNSDLAYDDSTLEGAPRLMQMALENLSGLEKRWASSTGGIDGGATPPVFRTLVLTESPDDPRTIRFHDASIERPHVAHTRFALESKRRGGATGSRENASTDWKTIDAQGMFSFEVPASMREVKVRGIDSYVGQYADDTLRLVFDYGAYSNPLDQVEGGKALWVKIDGRRAKVVEAKTSALPFGHLVAVHFPELGRSSIGPTKLTLEIQYVAEADARTARKIIQSIRFPKS